MLRSFFAPVLLLAALLLHLPAQSQIRLDGQVRDARTQQPLAFATVFLANTTYGTTTDSTGHFALAGLPAGQYELMVSYVGYDLYKSLFDLRQSVTLTPGLQPAAQLAEVVVRPAQNRPADYRQFLREFLGASALSQQCRIENPAEVVVVVDQRRQELVAVAPRHLSVINQALGYRITYHHFDFRVDYTSRRITFVAAPMFEALKSTNAGQQQRWEANRRKAYAGSLPHFLRSVREDRLAQEGFRVQTMVSAPNSAPIQQRIKQAGDSLAAVLTPAPGIVALVYQPALSAAQISQTGAEAGQVRLQSHFDLRVTYQGEHPDAQYAALVLEARRSELLNVAKSQWQANKAEITPGRNQLYEPVLEVSELHLLGPAALIQPNGYLTNPLSVKVDGYWAFEKVGEALPFDYVPALTR
ncbi:carboxypeptidase-like regulatory domain-containing protein [Hymenobacter sp. UYCo722]|uniref:carboxypeptidase-like regulatory domain-containing protein n=1 Tax=Hymenobacter sp. UYCo722 TaxID=3156335 RepID=UPI0033996462